MLILKIQEFFKSIQLTGISIPIVAYFQMLKLHETDRVSKSIKIVRSYLTASWIVPLGRAIGVRCE